MKARLIYKKQAAGPSRLSYLGHIVTEHKHGLIVESCLTQASKRAEWEAALAMLGNMASGGREITVAADRGYQEEKFIAAVRALGVVPLVAEYKPSKYWKNWLTREEREHPRFALSQKKRRLIEKVFSWIKNIAGLRRTKFRGRRRVEWAFRIAATAHNLVRMRKLIPAV
jgi:transposase